MALRYDAKKGEVVYIEGVRIQFATDSQLLLLDRIDILSTRMMISEKEANTPQKLFYRAIQNVYTLHRSERSERASELLFRWREQGASIVKDAALFESIERALELGDFYRIVRGLRTAIETTEPGFWASQAERVREEERPVKEFVPKHKRI